MLFSRAIFPEARRTLALAVPMTAGQVGQMMLGFCDSLMVGRLGVVPLAASALALGIFNVFFITGLGLVAGVSILAAEAHGAGRPTESGEVLRHGLAISAVSSLGMVLVLVLNLGALHRLGAPPEVVTAARPFLVLIGWSMLPALAWQCLKQYCESLSHPLLPMLTMFFGVALNVFLNWVLIWGHLGAPALGLVGSGWATLLTRLLLFGVLLVRVLRAGRFRPALPPRWLAPLSWPRLRAQLTLGAPVALQLLMEVGMFSLAAILMGRLGAVPLAAHQVALNYAAMTFMFPLGIAIAVSVRIAQAVGAGEWSRVRPIGVGGVGMSLVLMVVFAVGFLCLGGPLAGVFVSDAATAALAAQLLAVAGIFQVFDGTQVVSMSALRGLSDVKIPAVLSFLSYWVVALPTCYFLGVAGRPSAVGIWWGLAAGLAFAAMVLTARFVVKTAAGMARTPSITPQVRTGIFSEATSVPP